MNATLTQTQTSIADALAELNARRTKFDTLKAESDSLFNIVSPGRVNRPTASLADSLRARARQAANAEALVLAAADVDDVERRVADLREIDRAEQQAALLKKVRPLVAKLDRALAAAAEINNAVADVDADLSALGAHTPLALHELLAESASVASRLECWRRAMREDGLLD